MITKEKLDFAVKQVVEVCLDAKAGEASLVITDNDTRHIGEAIAAKLKNVTGNATVFVMENFGSRPADGSDPLKFPKAIADKMLVADISIYAADCKKGEYPSFRKPMVEMVTINKKLKHAHMPSINDAIMEMGMCADYNVVREITSKVKNIVENAKKIRVTTELGTDVEATFSKEIKWCPFDGHIARGIWSNLPDGEIFTAPEDINGVLVVDGVLGDHLSKYGLVDKNPVTIQINNGRAVDVKCSNKEIEVEFDKYIHQEENSDRVGEFAIGTNVGLTKLIGNLLQDEKFPGVHIAFGDPYPHETGAKWTANSHIDVVMQKVNVDVDGKVILKNGKFVI